MKGKSSVLSFNFICECIIAVFFLILAIFCPYGLYGDSGQYISMHMHREPIYPLFLWVFRVIFKDSLYLTVAAIAQNIINALACIVLFSFFTKRFNTTKATSVLILICTLLPYILTPVFSLTHLVLSSAILSEALTLPLFTLFIVDLISYALDGEKRNCVCSIIWGTLASLTRGSMMICIIAWMIVTVGRWVYQKKKWFTLILPIVIMASLFEARAGVCKLYNYVVNDIAIYNMCANMDIVTNIVYAADRDAGTYIEDETARKLFYEMYDRALTNGWNYQCADGNWYNKIAYLENAHDNLKFDYILKVEEEYYYDYLGDDYVGKNKFQDDICKIIAHSIIGSCLGRWIGNYIGLALFGVARSVVVAMPFTILPAMMLAISALVLCIISFVKKKHIYEAVALLIALMMLAANVCGTAIVIMCLSRYMVYSFAPFYITFLILVNGYIKDYKKEDK